MPASPADRKAAGSFRLEHAERLFPYLWQYKWRVLAAPPSPGIAAKSSQRQQALLLKELVDAIIKPGDASAVLVVPLGLLVGYGLLRLSTTLFTELRELVFAKATQGAQRRAGDLPAPARAVAALPPGAADRRHDARHRARGARHRVADLYSLYSIVPT